MSNKKQHIIQYILENKRKHGNLFVDVQEVFNNYSLEEIKKATIDLYKHKSQINIDNFEKLPDEEKLKKICEYVNDEISEEVKQQSNIEFVLGLILNNYQRK